MKRFAPLLLAAALFLPALASAQTTYPAGSAGAMCLDNCDGGCTTYTDGSASCAQQNGNTMLFPATSISNTSSAPTGSTPNGGLCSVGATCQSGYCNFSTPSVCAPNPGTTGLPSGSSYGTTNTTGTGGINTTYLQGYEQSIVGVINNILVPLLISIAFIVFLWGVYKYFILGAASPEDRKEGTQFVMWGIIGFAIIFSVWGLVNILLSTLGLSSGGAATTHGLTPPTL